MRFVGYATPEDTLQSLFWAGHNHDFTNLLQAFVPEKAQLLQTQFEAGGAESFFQKADSLIDIRILDRKQGTDGTVVLSVEIVPGESPEHVPFRQVNGQWRAEGF
jgi:hypothetical protein